MSTATHTPGPWFFGCDSGACDTDNCMDPTHRGPFPIYAHGDGGGIHAEVSTTRADARLIAAAPALLAALQGMVRAVGGTSGDCALCGGGPEPDAELYEGHHVRCPAAAALHALAAAEGRAP